jgi:hypothetical protein
MAAKEETSGRTDPPGNDESSDEEEFGVGLEHIVA